MAALAAPPILLGERPDRALDTLPSQAVASGWDEQTTAFVPVDKVGTPSLVDIAGVVERSAAAEVTISADDLPDALRCRAALAALTRRAHRTGKTLRLAGGSPDLRAIAAAEGWTVGRTGRPGAAASAEPIPALPATGAETKGLLPHRWPVEPWRVLAGRLAQASRAAVVAYGLQRPKRVGAASFVGGAAGAVALLVGTVLLVPSATVTLTPAVEQLALDLPVVVDPSAKQPDVGRGVLPGRIVSKELSETQHAPATGRRPAPDARASGEVVFINKTERPVVVPKGTVVLAGSVRFATQQDLNVGGTVFAGPQQRISMQRVPVQAVNGGVDGNVGRFQINKVEGPLGQQMDVQNDAATRGGSEKTISFVTAEDRRKLQEALTKSLTDRLMQQIKGQLPSPDKETVVPWTGQSPSVVEAAFSKNEGDEAQTFSLTLKVRYGATIFGNDAYNAFVRQLAVQQAGQQRPGYELPGKSVNPTAPEVQGIQDGAVRLLAHAKGTLAPRIEPGLVRAGVANRPVDQAQTFVQTLPGVTHAEITSWPGWLGRTPLLGWRIAVRSPV